MTSNSKSIFSEVLDDANKSQNSDDARKSNDSDNKAQTSSDSKQKNDSDSSKSKKHKSSSTGERKSSSDESKSWSILTDTLKEGFASMQQSMVNMGSDIAAKIVSEIGPQNYEDEYDDDDDNNYEEEGFGESFNEEPTVSNNSTSANVFDSVVKNFLPIDKVGPNIEQKLADMTNALLKGNLSDASLKEKTEKYPRPGNCSFVQAPKMNKEIWNALTYDPRSSDLALQEVQANFLRSITPVLGVIESLYQKKDVVDSNSFDVIAMIKTLSDSIAFIGKANIGMVKFRKEAVRHNLASKFQRVCNTPTDFSGELLFGDKLPQDLKDINEGNKVSGQLSLRGLAYSYSSRRNYYPQQQGSYRGTRRGARGRGRSNYRNSRYAPYGSRASNSKRPYSGGSQRGGSQAKKETAAQSAQQTTSQ